MVKTMKNVGRIIVSLVCFVLISSVPSLAFHSGRAQYDKALRFIEKKNYDFALMELRSIIRQFPESKYAEKALFSISEYYYERGMYYEAIRNFSEYIKTCPDSDGTIFARAYVLKMINIIKGPSEKHKTLIQKLEMAFFSQPLFLLFSDYKEFSYKSIFANSFSIRYYIDAVEIYRNDELFIKITK